MSWISSKATQRILVSAALLLLAAGPAWPWADLPASQPTSAPAKGFTHAVLIPIDDEMITDVTVESLRRRIDRAREDGADLLIFEMNTPGGMVSSAMEICNLIRDLTDVKTVAWVHPQALSAGAMISVWCDEIVISPSGSIGDCAPILVGPGGLQELAPTERAKMDSPIRQIFRDAAHRNGYDTLLCDAMVRIGREIFWVENTETGERRFVDAEKKAELLGEARTGGGLLSGLTGRSRDRKTDWQLVETLRNLISDRDVPAKQPVVEEVELLTLSASEAVAYGFAKGVVKDESDLRERYGITGPIETLDFEWSEGLAAWLTSPSVRGLLMIFVFMGAYTEFKAPGLGLPGAVALISLTVLLGAPYVTGLASVWEIVIVVIGVVLCCVELFILPGFGIAGILGILLILGGVLATFVPAEPGPHFLPQLDATWDLFKEGVRTISISLVLSLIGIVALAKYFPRLPGTRLLVLDGGEVPIDQPYVAGRVATPSVVPVGAQGTAVTTLRPAGKASIDGQRVDVVTEGEMIDAGAAVRVVRAEGNRIVVRAADA